MGEAAAKAEREEAVRFNLKKDMGAAVKKIEELTAENEALRREVQGSRADVELGRGLAKKVDRLEGELDRATDVCARLRIEIADAEKEAQMQREERAKLQDKLDKEGWSKGCAEIDAEHWRQGFLQARAQRDELAAQMDAMGDVRELREKVRGLEHDVAQWREEAADTADRYNSLLRMRGGTGQIAKERDKALSDRELFRRQRDEALAKLRAVISELGMVSEVIDEWGVDRYRQAVAVVKEELRIARSARDEALAKLAAMEKRTTAVYDGCSGLTEENEELREEVRRLTEVSLGLAAIVAGKG